MWNNKRSLRIRMAVAIAGAGLMAGTAAAQSTAPPPATQSPPPATQSTPPATQSTPPPTKPAPPPIPQTGPGANGPVKPAPKSPPPVSPPIIPGRAEAVFVLGIDDVVSVSVWGEKEHSVEAAAVRPDGKISVPVIGEVPAAGLTPGELGLKIKELLTKIMKDPTVSVVVKEVNSRKVYILGNVAKPGPYRLNSSMTVLQLIAVAGGLLEYADKNIVVISTEKRPDGSPYSYRVNYDQLLDRKNLKQIIDLKPGDTVMVK